MLKEIGGFPEWSITEDILLTVEFLKKNGKLIISIYQLHAVLQQRQITISTCREKDGGEEI